MGQPDDLTARLTYLNFERADLQLLADLRPILEKHADAFVADFYRHLICCATNTTRAYFNMRGYIFQGLTEVLVSFLHALAAVCRTGVPQHRRTRPPPGTARTA